MGTAAAVDKPDVSGWLRLQRVANPLGRATL
jgi:hypothetical protein